MWFILRVAVAGFAIWLTTLFMDPHLRIEPPDASGWQTVGILAGVGLVFTLVNMILKPVLHVLAFPLYLLTLGLFSLVVNAGLLMLTAWITEQTDWGIRVENFGWAVLAALVIAILQVLVNAVIPGNQST
ncbi:phage holin family protein [Luteimicrobium subarcticum]|uniref:Putative membrane protein n=1 Tax=Luteimicrobium subarcticum TaxID=620910 RepID=A0A2M8WRX3_9MICO|nr:phage holin family protein [Luteimicrobium subarcticum]PJI93692.1 putative membrane protein [Luteimicrobium subarcticum]